MHKESLVMVALERELKEQLLGSLCSVIPHTAGAVSLKHTTPLQVISAWGKAIIPPGGITLPYPVELTPCCWGVELEDFHSLSLTESLQAELDLWELWQFSWPSPRPSAVKSQPGSFCTQTSPAKGATSYGLLIAPNKLHRANQRQGFT